MATALVQDSVGQSLTIGRTAIYDHTGVCEKKAKTFAKFSRNFREIFAKFSNVFKSFQRFSEVFGSFRKFPDVFRYVRTLLGRKHAGKPKRKSCTQTCIFTMFLRSWVKTELATPHPTGRKKNEKKQSVSKMKVQVVTINSVVESSKSELSSRGKRPFKVFRFYFFGFFFANTGTKRFLINVHTYFKNVCLFKLVSHYARTVVWSNKRF